MKMPFDYSVPDLKDNEIHLWSFDVPIGKEFSDEFFSCLSNDEIEKSKLLESKELIMKSISRYSLLRYILSEYMSQGPNKIIFEYDDNGKPGISGSNTPNFNLSHSGKKVLVGVTKTSPLGVDLQLIKNDTPIDSMAKKFFSKLELKKLKETSDREKRNLFYDIWTAKEALLKAKGLGLTVELNQTEVLYKNNNDGWSIIPYNYLPGYSMTIATPLNNPIIRVIAG